MERKRGIQQSCNFNEYEIRRCRKKEPEIEYTNRKYDRNAPCWCGSGKKYKKCHMHFDERIREFEFEGHEVPPREIIKNEEQIQGIRESAKINMAVLDAIEKEAHVGMNTQEIDDLVNEITYGMGGIPADLNYEGYPKSICTSINDQVCHGIPSKDVILKDGDICNMDASTILNGYFSDSSRMICFGNVSEEHRRLVQVTKECVEIGIEHVKPWTFLGDMGSAVHQHAKENGYSIVRDFGGHGCGLEFHEDPFVSYVSEPGTEMLMVPGMTFTIEPMVTMGGPDIRIDEENGWTVYTRDGSWTAQWEVQVLVTEDGCEVLSW